MKLFSEEIGSTKLSYITESDGPNGRGYMFLTGVFMEANTKNKNGRIYPLPILRKAVSVFDREYIQTHRAAGEIDHPPTPHINMERACMLIESLTFDGNQVYGKAKLTSTPSGQLIRQLVEDGFAVGCSSRGIGDTKFDNSRDADIIQDNYVIKAIDVVSNPSCPSAMLNGVYESIDWYIENGHLKARDAQQIHESIKKGNKKDIEKEMKTFFKRLKI